MVLREERFSFFGLFYVFGIIFHFFALFLPTVLSGKTVTSHHYGQGAELLVAHHQHGTRPTLGQGRGELRRRPVPRWHPCSAVYKGISGRNKREYTVLQTRGVRQTPHKQNACDEPRRGDGTKPGVQPWDKTWHLQLVLGTPKPTGEEHNVRRGVSEPLPQIRNNMRVCRWNRVFLSFAAWIIADKTVFFLYPPRHTLCSSPVGFGAPNTFPRLPSQSSGLHPVICSVTPLGVVGCIT